MNHFDWNRGFSLDFNLVTGFSDAAQTTKRCLSSMSGMFYNQEAAKLILQKGDPLIYEFYELGCPERPGDLSFGTTILYPGKIGNEYFMTKGHFHSNSDRAEFYWGVEGEGFLILMDERRNVWAERMFPGSLHYIPGKVAHRVANTGYQKLVFSACWPSDAGHDYATIADAGFARRLVDVNGVPTLV